MTSAKLTTAAVVLAAAALPVSVQVASTAGLPSRPPSARTGGAVPSLPVPARKAVSPAFDLTVIGQTLRRLMANADDYQTQLEVRRLLFSLTLEEIPAVLELLMDAPTGRREALHEAAYTLFARWAELAPAAAADAAFKLGKSAYGYYPLRGAFVTWACRDLDQAWVWLEKTTTDAMDREFLGGEALAGIVMDERRTPSILARLDAMQDQAWRDKLRYWVARASPRPAVDWALALPPGEQRTKWVPRTIELAGAKDPEWGMNQISHIENSERRNEVGHNILWPWLLRRPVDQVRDAPDMIDTLETQAGKWPGTLFRDAGDALTRHSPAKALETARRLPEGESRTEFIQGMLTGVSYSNAREMLPALSMISEDELVHHGGLGNFTEVLSRQDPRAAAEWIVTLPPQSDLRLFADSGFKSVTGSKAAEFLTRSPK